MTTRLRYVAPLQFGIVCAVMYFIIGLVEAVIFAVSAAPVSRAPGAPPASAIIWLAVAIPFIFTVVGFIGAVILAAVYNLVAGWTGGVELRFEHGPPPEATR